MKIKIKTHIAFFMMLLSVSPARACIGGNTPEALTKRAQNYFNSWDINKNNQLEVEEFLMSEDSFKLTSLEDPKMATQFLKEKLKFLPDFKAADTDQSQGLSFEEWIKIHPTSRFTVKCL